MITSVTLDNYRKMVKKIEQLKSIANNIAVLADKILEDAFSDDPVNFTYDSQMTQQQYEEEEEIKREMIMAAGKTYYDGED